jgi:hypothetical protein
MTPRRTALTAAALVTPALLAAMLVAPTAATADDGLMGAIGRYEAPRTPVIPGAPDEADEVRAESHAVLGDRLYSTNHTSLDIVDISDPSAPGLIKQLDLSSYGANGITSVAASKGRVAVAIPATDKTKPGTVVVMDPDGKVLAEVPVGALPDMLTFDDKGQMLVVANEGEPTAYPSTAETDPEGSVTVIYIDRLLKSQGKSVTTIGFTDFNEGGSRHAELPADVRIFGPGASVAQDLEPEYITIEGNRGYVSLQENNAVAELDLRSGRVIAIRPLALKDHSLDGNGLDPSDSEVSKDPRVGSISIANWPVFGMPQPDAIASYVVGGQTYIISANEGDARDYDGFAEESRVKDLADDFSIPLDVDVFPNAADLLKDSALGRLTVTTVGADSDGNGKTDKILAFGTRSMSIWQADGTRVWDSGDILEEQTALALPEHFNNNNDENAFDNRSDNKGPEPEGVAVGEIGDRTYAFVGLERVGGMAVFDVTNPASATFVEYVTTRDFTKSPTDGSTDSGPEVMSFVSAEDSPNGKPLVIMSNEWSGSIVIWSPKS